MNASATLMLRALDGDSPTLSLADARRYRMIVALAMDGVPMSVGGLGPLWAVYDADRLPISRTSRSTSASRSARGRSTTSK
jgi:hypothetical protein